jgi:RNA methyltransferase, TrmH family
VSRKESLVYGVRASLAIAQHRPDAILRVLHTADARYGIAPLLKATARGRRPYREVDVEELNRAAATVHHEGVLVVSKPLSTQPFGRYVDRIPKQCLMVALDRVSNPHNQGAILRSMAWFGADALLTSDPRETVNPAAIRVSQGGAELVKTVRAPELPRALRALADRGVAVVAADQSATQPLDTVLDGRPICWVMGNEGEGLSAEVKDACTDRVAIPGTGAVESLNVSVAAGILLAMSRR